MMGAEVDISSGDALELSVRLARGAVSYYQVVMMGFGPDTPLNERDATMAGFERAVERLNRMAKNAQDAGIDERRMRVIEQESDRIIQAAEAAIAVVKLDAAARTLFAREFAARLAGMGQAAIEGSAVDL
jgi:nucleotide-binding universal stress UspA family protein